MNLNYAANIKNLNALEHDDRQDALEYDAQYLIY